jgi:hypothetical protein
MDSWKKHKFATFIDFIASKNRGDDGVVYGKSFEIFSHIQLSEGGKFRQRTLHDINYQIPERRKHAVNISIPPREVIIIPNSPKFNRKMKSAYLKPEHGNFGAADSVVLGNLEIVLYQSTINSNHGVNAEALARLLRLIDNYTKNNSMKVRFIFVVPDYKFELFGLQTYDGEISDSYKIRIEQCVLELKTAY